MSHVGFRKPYTKTIHKGPPDRQCCAHSPAPPPPQPGPLTRENGKSFKTPKFTCIVFLVRLCWGPVACSCLTLAFGGTLNLFFCRVRDNVGPRPAPFCQPAARPKALPGQEEKGKPLRKPKEGLYPFFSSRQNSEKNLT